jgi:uncharacterized protein YjbI with pentapeptide repeats
VFHTLRAGIVCILKPSGHISGTGFIVSSHLIATCAHVIKFAGAKPGSIVTCLRLGDHCKFEALVEEQYWRDTEVDVAFLKAIDPFPENTPLKLGSSANISNHSFVSYGFPANIPRELQVRGSILGETNDCSRLELRSREIVEGVSGAPVFDQQTQRVVGMIVERTKPDIREEERKIRFAKGHEIYSGSIPIAVSTGRLEDIAYAIPSQILLTICPELSFENICPYQGLAAFTEANASFFYGRDKLVDQLVEQLRRNSRFSAIVGSSGSGKSSLIQAGLFPRIRQGDILGYRDCQIINFRPGTAPKDEFINAIESIEVNGNSSSDNLCPKLENKHFNKNSFWSDIHKFFYAHSTHTFIFIDQFEELFALCSPEVQREFNEGLLSLIEANLAITIIVAIRADFYARLLDSNLGNQPKFEVLRMNEQELSSVIAQPAQKVGLQIETGLIDLLIRDLENTKNPLSLLEFTLTQLWKIEHLTNRLTCNCYRRIGRVTGAVAHWADTTYYALSEVEQKLTYQIFSRLIQYSLHEGIETRRRRYFKELANQFQRCEAIHCLLKKLADSRLIVTDIDPKTGEETVEIIHEVLFQEWQKLQQWISRNRNNLIQREKIESIAEDWKSSGEHKDYLLKGKQLNDAIAYLRNYGKDLPLSETAEDCIQISTKQRWLGRVQLISLITIPVFLIAIPIESYLRGQQIRDARNNIEITFQNTNRTNVKDYVQYLTEGCYEQSNIKWLPKYFLDRIFGNCVSLNQYLLSNADLQRVDLRNVDLHSARLDGTNLQGANLQEASFINANLEGADLRTANLQESNFQDASLQGADLSGLDLRDVNLSGTLLRLANLSGVELTNVHLPQLDLGSATLHHAKLDGAYLDGAILEGSMLRNSSFDGASLQGTNLQNANLSHASLANADLSGADLRNSYLTSVIFKGANLEGINLGEANLKDSSLTEVQLNQAKLCNTTLPDGSKNNRDCNSNRIISNTAVVGEVLCGHTMDYTRRRRILSATIEPSDKEFKFRVREENSVHLLLLDPDLVVVEAYSIEGADHMPWNLVAYDGSPMKVSQDGVFSLVMMVSTRSTCEFRGKLEFLGDAETKLFSN